MARIHATTLTVTALVAIFTLSSEARADESAPASSNASAAASTKASIEKDPIQKAPPDDMKHVSLTANPLSLVIRRVGVNVEYLPVRHHALVLSPYFQFGSAKEDSPPTTLESKLTTFGAEAGYRFYSGTEGANGLFVGPAVFVQRSQVKTTSTTNGASTASDIDIMAYGGILDVGGQLVTDGGFTIGAGAGVMYMFGEAKGVATSSTMRFSGLAPRLLLTLGYSF